jgi:hypothetical protein
MEDCLVLVAKWEELALEQEERRACSFAAMSKSK